MWSKKLCPKKFDTPTRRLFFFFLKKKKKKKKKSVCVLCKVPFVCLFVCFFEREEEEEEEEEQDQKNKTRKKSSFLIIEREKTHEKKKQKEKKGREKNTFSLRFFLLLGFFFGFRFSKYCAFFEKSAFLCFWFLFLSFVSRIKRAAKKRKAFAIHRFIIIT